MTSGDFMLSANDCGADAAAYVLGALEPAELEAFDRHLASCAVCRDEVAAFQQVADALPLAAQQFAPPKRLRRRVLRGLRAEATMASEGAGRRRAWLQVPRGLVPRPALALGATLAIAVAAIVGVQLGSQGASSGHVYRAQVIGLPGSAELRVSGAHGELIVNHLPPPPAGRIYEVWLQRGKLAPSPTSALFSVTANGAGDVDVPGNLHGVTQMMVTQEPAGGSLVPTHAPVIVARLS
jgi:anti-sigma-K factor RskA